MSKFIIGKWRIISITDIENGNTIDISFAGFEFENEAEVTYGDFYRDSYAFSEPDTITVKYKRIVEIETWRLERDRDHLIIYGPLGKNKKYLLERCTGLLSEWLMC